MSPPSRAVHFCLKMLSCDFEYKNVDLSKGEHKTEEYLKMNPDGAVPTIKDGDFVLSESRAILTYLVEKYGKDEHDSLYPRDLAKRAMVDIGMFSNIDLYLAFVNSGAAGVLFAGAEVDASKFEAVWTQLEKFDKYWCENFEKPNVSDLYVFHLTQMIFESKIGKAIGKSWEDFPGLCKVKSCLEKCDCFEEVNGQFKTAISQL